MHHVRHNNEITFYYTYDDGTFIIRFRIIKLCIERTETDPDDDFAYYSEMLIST